MSDSDPRLSPNSAPETPEDAKVFGYDVASQASKPPEQKPNPMSPLAAG